VRGGERPLRQVRLVEPLRRVVLPDMPARPRMRCDLRLLHADEHVDHIVHDVNIEYQDYKYDIDGFDDDDEYNDIDSDDHGLGDDRGCRAASLGVLRHVVRR